MTATNQPLALPAVTKSLLDQRIEATIMAVREELMSYYKGTCVERLTDNSNIRRHSILTARQPYQYQRLALEQRQCQFLLLGDYHIATLEKLPDELTLYTATLASSPGLRKLEIELEKFISNYLCGVEVKRNREGQTRPLDDEKLFTATVKDRQQRGPKLNAKQAMEYFYRVESDIIVPQPPMYWDEYTSLTSDTPF